MLHCRKTPPRPAFDCRHRYGPLARDLTLPSRRLVRANCGEDMAIVPALRKMAGTYAQTGGIPARFVAEGIVYQLC